MSRDTDELDIDGPSIDTDEDPLRTTWDESTPPSVALVEAIEAVTDREQSDPVPLDGWVDTDALDRLLTAEIPSDTTLTLSFENDGIRVSVGSDGTLLVRRGDVAHDRTRSGPTTNRDLTTRLAELCRAASDNGVFVPGAYEVHNGPEHLDWEIHITRIDRTVDRDA